MAGFFDGEGSIFNNINTMTKSHRFRWVISIAQKRIKVLKIIKTFLFKKDIEVNIHTNNNGISYIKIETQINQILFLENILPYLIVKRTEAEICLKWNKDNISNRNRLHLIEKRKIKELNSLGYNYSEIGKELKRPHQTIMNYLNKEKLLSDKLEIENSLKREGLLN